MKKVAMGVALALAGSAFAAHPQTINKEGFVGVNKTQSAQSLGSSKLVFTLLGDGTFGNDMFPNNDFTGTALQQKFTLGTSSQTIDAPISDYMGASAYVGFAIGIGSYFDLGVTLPVYYDQMTAEGVVSNNGVPASTESGAVTAPITGVKMGYVGNLKGDLKFRFPLPDDQPIDMAIFGGVEAGTANVTKQGLWIRHLSYINKNTGVAMPFGTKNTSLKGGLAVTADFSKLDGGDGFPFLVHINGGYNYVMNTDYMSNPFVSAAAEVYVMDFLSLFAEFFWDMQLDPFDYYGATVDSLTGARIPGLEQKLDNKAITGGVVFHLPIGMDIHLGASYYLGGKDNFLNDVYVLSNGERKNENIGTAGEFSVKAERIRATPQYTVYGGLTWSGFLLAQDRDGDGVVDDEDNCPDDYGHRLNQGCPLGNPDADEDGVCDAWVAEKGFQSEFADVCEGVDQCPNEAGEGDDGCPLDDPDPDKDGVCDAWVSQKKLSKKFKDICEGIDECPNQAGSAQFGGCPTKQPDPDGDGLCSPWVTDEGALDQFAGVCKGYDMCPGEAGAVANKGCPWDDPDSDNDGLCDEWVTQKKMGYYFEKAAEDENLKAEYAITKTCKGIDKCPTEFGPANNEGCPLGNPDTDQDGICDAWVTERGMLDQYDGICSGIDKCPNEAGEAFAEGCPMDNPDADGDSLCAPWVTEKNMLAQFANVCHGLDKCPVEAGPEWNKGCPAEDPDPDQDGVCSQWVTKQKMLDQFKDICTGKDQCEDEAGPAWNKGCPADDPDPDQDSLCSPWVTKQKMLEQYKDVCHGYDRCEDENGPEWNNGCPSDEDPDADKDGVCSEWVTNKKLLKQFEGVCSGIDRCPDVAGDDGHGCPKKAPEKLDGVTFKSGKATLESNAKKILKSVAKKLVENDEYKDLKIVIQGHTDNVGKEAKNIKLSKQRAEAVMKELTKAGVKKDRIKAIGMGPTCPVDDNSTADGREMNRRIEMLFVSPDDDGEGCHSNYVP
ncbi:OmpA family protein [Fibrobacter sp. UWEL]|uniref:OmpA family protein n=1 Tax=Fibrobacter sp. UWEL TaxID=1896209 RepID=UPI000922A7A5|nr:OmpA family protein [Fibrobacter sp. UWEL]SHL05965.1 OmpA family protein [Fibrobacter sp. UWEL]